MAQAQLKTQKIFGGNLIAGQTSVAALGSTAAGGTVYSLDVDVLQNTQWEDGVNDSVVVQNPNPASIPDYNPLTPYNANDYAKDSMTQLVYISLFNGNVGNPFTDNAAWKNVNYKFFPYQETINSIDYAMSNNVAAIQQEGILPWLSTTAYNQYALVKSPGTSEIYQSIFVGVNQGNALTNLTFWKSLGDLENLQQATTTLQGTMRIATQTEVNDGIDNTTAVTPFTLNNIPNLKTNVSLTYNGFNGTFGYTLIPFDDIIINDGNYWDIVTFTFTPPAGKYKFSFGMWVDITANGLGNTASSSLYLYKNGTTLTQGNNAKVTACVAAVVSSAALSGLNVNSSPALETVDQANGTDFYQLFISQNAVGGDTVRSYNINFNISSI